MTERMVVSGAGIGGLCAALALLQRGFDVTVCEQASELREVGAGVQLSPNGTRVPASLGVLDDLRVVAVEAEAKEIRLWNSGEKWPLFDLGAAAMAEYGFPYPMLHRGDLQTVLAKRRGTSRPNGTKRRFVSAITGCSPTTRLAVRSRASRAITSRQRRIEPEPARNLN
jgi:salicylate hydroxylase